MLHRSQGLESLTLHAFDGELGRVSDLVIDDRWVARYLVVTPGSWLRRPVAISPIAVESIDWPHAHLQVRLTREQVRASPDLLSVMPPSRDAELAYATYYGYPAYWGGPELWGWAGRPGALALAPLQPYPTPDDADNRSDLRLVSTVRGRHLAAREGTIGHVDDLFVDTDTWTMPFFLVDTSNAIGGQWVVVPTSSARDDASDGGDLAVDLSLEDVWHAPRFDENRGFDDALEQAVQLRFGRSPREGAPGVGTR